MKPQEIFYFLLIIIVAIGATVFITHYAWPKKETVQLDRSKSDTTYITKTVHDRPETKFKVVYRDKPANIDSLYAEAKEFWRDKILKSDTLKKNGLDFEDPLEHYSFTALADTVYCDSSLLAYVSYNSPIPLHPKSYFDLSFSIKERIISTPYMKKESFWDRFSWSLNAGAGIGLINRQFDVYIGLGGSFRL